MFQDTIRLESEVRSYSRQFPVIFDRAIGSYMYDKDGQQWLDFLCAAGSLNYGHNNPVLTNPVIDYLQRGGVTNSLDLMTIARNRFLDCFNEVILQPRQMSYRVQFTGPTGANAVEASLKLARMYTDRRQVAAFTNGFHGVSLGCLALTGNEDNRAAAGSGLPDVIRVPYEGYINDCDGLALIDAMIGDPSSGVEAPAAFIVETVQGEGGVKAATYDWLRRLADLARKYGSLLIVDDIQAGCGRTGTFFSFEAAGIRPDIICLSKSVGAIGIPMSLVLLKPELDIWRPGQHNGTFRGNNLAFIAAQAALEYFWRDGRFVEDLVETVARLDNGLNTIVSTRAETGVSVRGRGMMRGLAFTDLKAAKMVASECFRRGLICECCGPYDEVIKLLPPLTASGDEIEEAIDIISESIRATTLGGRRMG